MNFDGLTAVVSNNTTSYNGLTNQTVAAWIRPIDGGEGNLGRIYHKGTPLAGHLNVQIDNANAAPTNKINGIQVDHRFSTTNGFWATTVNNSITTGNTFQHLVVTYTNTSTANLPSIFINGSSYGVTTYQQPVGTVPADDSMVYVGNRNGVDRTFNGDILDLAVWNVILTQQEISLLANSRVLGMPLQVQPSSLVLYYPGDDFPDGLTVAGGTIVMDRSGKANHGTAAGTLKGAANPILSYP